MAATLHTPQQWCLTQMETVTTFENWHQNLVYTLSLDAHFAPFLVHRTTWLKKPKLALSVAYFLITNDGSLVAESRCHTTQINAWTDSKLLPSYLQKHYHQKFHFHGLNLVGHSHTFWL